MVGQNFSVVFEANLGYMRLCRSATKAKRMGGKGRLDEKASSKNTSLECLVLECKDGGVGWERVKGHRSYHEDFASQISECAVSK